MYGFICARGRSGSSFEYLLLPRGSGSLKETACCMFLMTIMRGSALVGYRTVCCLHAVPFRTAEWLNESSASVMFRMFVFRSMSSCMLSRGC
jgi:hypothetical protein